MGIETGSGSEAQVELQLMISSDDVTMGNIAEIIDISNLNLNH